MRKNYIFTIIGAIVFLMASSVNAQVFSGKALEAFSYPAGDTLNGKDAPEGFIGKWSKSNAEWDGTATVIAEGLSYPGIVSSGGALYIETGTVETQFRVWYNDTVFTPSTTLWASMLFKSDEDLTGAGQVWLQPAAGTTGPQEESGFGYHWAGNFKSVGNWDAEGFGPAIMAESTYLLLARYEIGADSSAVATYWVNPDLDPESGEPIADSAFFTASWDKILRSDSLALWAGYGESGITVDEIRISTESALDLVFEGTAMEAFDYAADESLIGQMAPEGFSGAWASTGDDWDGTATITAEGLSYPDMATTAGALYLETGSNETRLICNYQGNVFAPGTTLWASMLFKSDEDLTGSGQVWLQPSGGTTGPQEESGFGYHWAGNFKSVGNWDDSGYGPAIMGGTTYLLVAKYVIATDGSAEATYWANPDLSAGELVADSAFFTTSFDVMYTSDYVALWAGYGESGITIDEVRLSSSEKFVEEVYAPVFEGTALEPFDYTVDESLIGKTAPEGFSGEWTSNSDEWDGSATVIAEGLTYPGMATTAGALYLATGTNETQLRVMYNGSVLAPNTTTWASMLFKSDEDLSGAGQVWLQTSGGQTGPQEESGFGYHWAGNFKSVGNWDAEGYGPAIMANTTYLLLAKYEIGEDGVALASYWVDPSAGEPLASSAFFTTSFDAIATSDFLALWAGYGESGITIDEIRISTESAPSVVVNVEREDVIADFQVYPNPSNGQFTVQLTSDSELTIFSVNGAMVYRNLLQSGASQVDVSELNSGLYMIQVANENGKSFRKVVIE